ncbi:unnamed protein product [Acanthoscelides obtectus]|uniref:KIF-binding protein n=1 Tax=Acanthoscelides obtectus TaxID=200917 RepID=A0A9P0NX93_ACAOB|nr:unnamed protein product [Acanthoscelides obtectus]CAK1637421.1 KIF1-binding protein homolog [Acanthoscelides obtectus]
MKRSILTVKNKYGHSIRYVFLVNSVKVCLNFVQNTDCIFRRLLHRSKEIKSKINKMTIAKETFSDLQEKYTKVKKLVDEDSKLDPEDEPYLSKYSARQILIGMKASIEKLLRQYSPSDDNDEHFIKLTAMLGTTYLYLGTIAVDTEEISTGEKHLEKCKEIISKYEATPQVILITLNMYNHLGIIWAPREPEVAKVHLEKAETLYKTAKDQSLIPVDITDLFQANIEEYNTALALKNLEKLHTLTLYFLAQIYGAGSLKDPLKSAAYCHKTLQRQLDTDDRDCIDWALNAAALSQFFMEKNGFKQARHHLAASLYILQQYEDKLRSEVQELEVHEAKMETLRFRKADVARCWAKYGLNLLAKSKERLLNHTDDIDKNCSTATDLTQMELPPDSTVSKEDLQNLDFDILEIATYELQVSDRFALTLEDAKKIFLNAQHWIELAQEYYTLDTLASDYIETVLDHSQLYLSLLFFDDDPANQAKYHKRRADLLENILSKVSTQYYLQHCRQIWFELGRTYSDMLDIKSEKMREIKGRPPSSAISKINQLVDKSIKNFTAFIESYKEPTYVTDILTQEEGPILQAYFHLAALHGRYIDLDKNLQLQHSEASLKNYSYVAEYCEKHASTKDIIPMEYSICKEMVSLLPIKLLKLNNP